MDVSLQLMEIHVQNGADLLTRSEISIPSQDTERCEWQTVTSLIKPPELCRDHSVDSPWDANIAPTKIVSTSENETRLKVRFPAEEWAHIFPRLTDLQLKYEESQRSQAFGGESFQNMLPAQEFLHQISMHQEIQSRCVPGMPFIRRAMILWTFRAVLPGETPQTTWRYIDATPPHSCISPSSCSSNQPSADNFTTWGDGPSHLQHQDILDPYIHGLISPPSTAGLQSSFGTDDYGYYGRPFNMPPGNMGFGSVSPVDSESPMLDNDMAGSISAFLSNTADVRIDGYDYSPPDWSMSHSESSNPGSTWAGYAAVPSNTPYIEHESELESHSWPIAMDPRLVNWVESRDGKGGWTEMDAEKPKPVYIEQSDDNLMPWLNTANNEPKDIYVDADDVQLPSLSRGGLSPEPVDLKDPRWTRSDSSFDFNQLVECLGS
jgi:transcriptional enhancer factor